jgi:hypothetical protein
MNVVLSNVYKSNSLALCTSAFFAIGEIYSSNGRNSLVHDAKRISIVHGRFGL